MLKERLDAAHAIRDSYLALKRETTELATAAGTCVGIMVEQRRRAGLAKAGFGARPIALVSRAAALIAEAEGYLADAHPALGEMIAEAGLTRYYVYGTGVDETPDPTVPEKQTVLRVAA